MDGGGEGGVSGSASTRAITKSISEQGHMEMRTIFTQAQSGMDVIYIRQTEPTPI